MSICAKVSLRLSNNFIDAAGQYAANESIATNVKVARITSHYWGAIYGWSIPSRFGSCSICWQVK